MLVSHYTERNAFVETLSPHFGLFRYLLSLLQNQRTFLLLQKLLIYQIRIIVGGHPHCMEHNA